MRRASLVAWIAVLIAGCHNAPQPALNPFLGRTRVPPPSTGQFAPPAQPYYQQPPAGTTSPPGATSPPAYEPNLPSNSAPTYNPPPATPSSAPNSLPYQSLQRNAVPPTSADASDSSGWEMVTTNYRGAFQPARPVASSKKRELYDRDPEYGWLRGRLEYSRFSRRYKLRYIPVDGEMDEYGGSLALIRTPLLDSFEEGDFVHIEGRLFLPTHKKSNYTPKYEIERIRPAP